MSNGGALYDAESGGGHSHLEESDFVDDPFHVVRTKTASLERLTRWRQSALVLNASRRFRYTLDLKKAEEKKEIIAKMRLHAQVIRAAYLYQAAGEKPNAPLSPIPTGDYDVSPNQLSRMTRDQDFPALQSFGGVKGLAEMLKTNLDKGIHEDDSNILDRKNVFGSNTYSRKKGQSFWRFMLDASRDTTLIILMVAAAASLALGIKTHGIKEGWYDGGSIALAVIIVILVTAISDYKQSLQFQNLNEEKQNIQLEVVRGGRRVEISIFDIVAGDVIPLKIGDQVPADGVLISGHSLAIDESSMTGESKIVHKDHKSPFLMSGCKVADGYGTMLATSFGINTEWGLLMAVISEDNGEETSLQVRLNGIATSIGIGGLMVAVFVLIILLARFFTGHTKDEDGKVEFVAGQTNVGDAVNGVFKIFIKVVTFVGDAADGAIKIFTVVLLILIIIAMSNIGRLYDVEYESYDDLFDIASTKSVPVERLMKWRQAALVLNASRRFRYTLDLKKEEEKKRILAQIRVHAQNIRAAILFASGSYPTASLSPIPIGDYGISPEQLTKMTKDNNFFALRIFGGVKGLAEMLKTNLDKGIHEDDSTISDRKDVFGSNTYPRKKGQSIWRFMLDASRDITLIILMVAAAASLALGIKTHGIKAGWYDGGSIALAVIIVILVTAISDYKQSLQFQNLNEEKQNIQLEVVRGGRRVEISIYDIVVGDVIPLNIGDQVPADGVLISGHSLAIDESNMTGESRIVHKDHKSPFLMSGCMVADGYGTMLAASVGINTEWGSLMSSISEDNSEETPLQVRLNGVATFIGIGALMVAVFVLIILLARFFTGHTKDEDGKVEFVAGETNVGDAVDGVFKIFIKVVTFVGDAADGVIKIFSIVVTIVVVTVPEGIPLAITLTLAYSMRKMMADKALVRRLSTCEIMGSATTICSDKTGTLTLNLMTVVEAYICGKKINPPNNWSELPSGATSLLFESVAQNTTGSVFLPEGGKDVEIFGSPTEKAILQWGINLGMNFEAVRSESSVIHAFPFNSVKKRGGVAVKRPDSQVHVHWKGAAEIVLAACTTYMDSNEQLVPLDDKMVEYLRKVIETMAAGSLRCVAIAYRPLKAETVPTDEELSIWELPEDDLVLLAIVGLKDPCRPGVKDAVQLCVKAGVKVRMVTGDSLQTARAIALECGILGSNADATEPNLIEGKSFRAMSEAERLEVANKISVMGRSSPNDKLLLVQALRKRGHVVAVTGDGTNDAPALHEADVGLAMGIQGTEVAKQSSDIIILDDNFASVVKAVRWGRSIYENSQKFIQFQLTVNVASLVINVIAAVSSGDVPLTSVQLLWVNLIMDTLGALALATEPPTDHLMDRLPVGRREPLITNIMWRNLLVQALYQVSVLLVLYFRGREILHSQHDPYKHANKEKNTLIFNAFVFSQIFNEFNARKPDEINVFKGVTKNRLFMGIVGFTVVLQVVLVMFLGKFTSTVRLSWQLWLVSIAIALISWPLAVVGKLIPVPGRPFRDYFVDMFGFCIRRRNRGLPASRLLAVVAKSIPIAVIILFTCLHFVHS